MSECDGETKKEGELCQQAPPGGSDVSRSGDVSLHMFPRGGCSFPGLRHKCRWTVGLEPEGFSFKENRATTTLPDCVGKRDDGR